MGFKRFGAARLRLCESSGSEHDSPDTDLSHLVNSFIEIECCAAHDDDLEACRGVDHKTSLSNSKIMTTTRNLLLDMFNDGDDDDARKKIAVEIQSAINNIVGESPSKRRLMSHLRDRGFDAGLCKSRWEKLGRHPAGEHEYVDVRSVDGNRYIIEVFLVEEFEIARPTDEYAALLGVFPKVFVGKPEELLKIVRVMSNAIKDSMKSKDLQVPPWRSKGYMEAKWFSGYKRTTYYTPSDATSGSLAYKCIKNRSIGFPSVPDSTHFRCSDDIIRRVASTKQGFLTAALEEKP